MNTTLPARKDRGVGKGRGTGGKADMAEKPMGGYAKASQKLFAQAGFRSQNNFGLWYCSVRSGTCMTCTVRTQYAGTRRYV